MLGEHFSLADLTGKYDAVFLGIGLGGVNALRAEGEDADGVDNAIDFIADAAPGQRSRQRCRSAAASS